MSASNVKVNIANNKCCVWEERGEIIIMMKKKMLSDLWSKMNSNSFLWQIVVVPRSKSGSGFRQCHFKKEGVRVWPWRSWLARGSVLPAFEKGLPLTLYSSSSPSFLDRWGTVRERGIFRRPESDLETMQRHISGTSVGCVNWMNEASWNLCHFP